MTASRAKHDSSLSSEFRTLRDAVKTTRVVAAEVDRDADALRRAAVDMSAALLRFNATLQKAVDEKCPDAAVVNADAQRAVDLLAATLGGIAEACTVASTAIRHDVLLRADQTRELKAAAYAAVVGTSGDIDRNVKSAMAGGLAAERALMVSMSPASGAAATATGPGRLAETQTVAVSAMRDIETTFTAVLHRLVDKVRSSTVAAGVSNAAPAAPPPPAPPHRERTVSVCKQTDATLTPASATTSPRIDAFPVKVHAGESPRALRHSFAGATNVSTGSPRGIGPQRASFSTVGTAVSPLHGGSPGLTGRRRGSADGAIGESLRHLPAAGVHSVLTPFTLSPPALPPRVPGPASEPAVTDADAEQIHMLMGELAVIRADGVRDDRTGQPGHLLVTNYRLRWFPNDIVCAATSASDSGSAEAISPLARVRAPSLMDLSCSPDDSDCLAARRLRRSNSDFGDTQFTLSPASAIADRRGRVASLATTGPGSVAGSAPASSASASSVSFSAGSSARADTQPPPVLSIYRRQPYLSMPLLSIARCEVVGGNRGALVLRTTELRAVSLSFADSNVDATGVRDAMEDYVWVKQPTFPLAHHVAPAAGEQNGWELYSPEGEFARLLTRCSATDIPRFAVCKLNVEHALCPTYPRYLIVPAAAADALVFKAAKYRSKRRLPAIVWFRDGVCLSRAAQPLPGILNTRSNADEQFVGAMRAPADRSARSRIPVEAASSTAAELLEAASHLDVQLAIFDARPRMNAIGNRGKGGGSESIANYPGCCLEFLNIDNIHVVRDALRALRGELLKTAARITAQGGMPAAATVGATAPPALLRSMTMVEARGSTDSGGRSRSGTQFGSVDVATRPTDVAAAIDSALDDIFRRTGGPSGIDSTSRTTQMDAIEGVESDAEVDDFTGDSDPESDDEKPDPAAAMASSGKAAARQQLRLEDLDSAADASSATPASASDTVSTPTTAGPPTTTVASALFVVGASPQSVLARSQRNKLGDDAEAPQTPSAGRTGVTGLVNAGRALMKFASRAQMKPSARPTLSNGSEECEDVVPHAPSSPSKDAASKPRVDAKDPAPWRTLGKPTGESSLPQWQRLLSILLAGGVRVAALLHAGTSVFVHCSDGWDRTAALTSIGQLLLDPYYRTLDGFCLLVEKEWCSFGHRFARRCGTGGSGAVRAAVNDDQRAPIFPQWCDAIWQIWRQFPTHFQFNERLLVALAEHAYSGRFGTFLFDNERDRDAANVRVATTSMWTYVLSSSHRGAFTNPMYAPPLGPAPPLQLLLPEVSAESLPVWPYWIAKWT